MWMKKFVNLLVTARSNVLNFIVIAGSIGYFFKDKLCLHERFGVLPAASQQYKTKYFQKSSSKLVNSAVKEIYNLFNLPNEGFSYNPVLNKFPSEKLANISDNFWKTKAIPDDQFEFCHGEEHDFWVAVVPRMETMFCKLEKLCYLLELVNLHSLEVLENKDDFLHFLGIILETIGEKAPFDVFLQTFKVVEAFSNQQELRRFIESSPRLMHLVNRAAEESSPGVFLPAWRLLENIRNASLEDNGIIYGSAVFPFIPPWHQTDLNASADIVLVHGIKGGAAYTWRMRDDTRTKDLLSQERRQYFHTHPQDKSTKVDDFYTFCWPYDWLSSDLTLPIRVLGVDYRSRWHDWVSATQIPTKLEESFDERVQRLYRTLKDAGVGKHPIIWVCHSMGGVILKRLLQMDRDESCSSKSNEGSSANCISQKTAGIAFLSVPHRGSPVADFVTTFSLVFRPADELRFIRTDSVLLEELQHFLREFFKENNIQILSLNESHPSPILYSFLDVNFIPANSADIHMGTYCELHDDHLNVCKPVSRSSPLYIELLNFIQHLLC